MRDIHLDLLRRRRPAPKISWLLLMAGGLAALFAVSLNALSHAMLERAQSAQSAAGDSRAVTLANPAQKSAARNATVDPHWEKLLSRLEQTKPKDIALLQLEADGLAGSVALVGQATTHDSMLTYLGKLNSEQGLQNVVLTQHSDADGASSRGVRFTIRLNWKHR